LTEIYDCNICCCSDYYGTRVKKTENDETIFYVNKYFEKNLTTGEVTVYYYLGDKLVAKKSDSTLNYIHQDHLTGTSVVSNNAGGLVSSISYFSFGANALAPSPSIKSSPASGSMAPALPVLVAIH
jgi:hypothetical protein